MGDIVSTRARSSKVFAH